MAAIKSYTDLPQSKKLAKILPITSIDFAWCIFSNGSTRLLPMDDWEVFEYAKSNVEIIPCWSLAALLNVLKDKITFGGNSSEGWFCCSTTKNPTKLLTIYRDSLIDACYEMILKLHEFKML